MSTIIDRFKLDGRVAIVTGASSGLGQGFARALLDAGASVVLGARREGQLRWLATALDPSGQMVRTRRTDVTDPEACTALAGLAMSEFGRLDILVNNAGVGTAVPALRETPEQFRNVVDVNLLGTYWMAQAAARVMEPGSSVVNIASVLGLIKSYAPQAAYSASKAAVMGLTRDLSQQWSGRKGIRVNAIAPGLVRTPMTERWLNDPQIRERVLADSPIRRAAEPGNIAGLVLFLASDLASIITGSVYPIDGARTAH